MDDENENLQDVGYLQDVISYIFDEKKIVTYKWISNTLNIHVNRAKQLLYTFIKHLPAERLEELKVTYLVGGILPDNKGCRIQVVCKEDLTKVKDNFKVITSEHIYSVSLKHCLTDLHDLYSVDGVKSNELSKHGALRCQQSLVKDAEKVAAKRNCIQVSSVADKKPAVEPKQEEKSSNAKAGNKRKANGISAMFSTASNKKKPEETVEPEKKEDNSKQEKTSVADKKVPSTKAASKGGKNAGGGRLAAMFSAQASKPKPVQNNVKEVKAKEDKDVKEKPPKDEVSIKKEKVSPKSAAKDDKKATEKKCLDEKSPKGQIKKPQSSKTKQKKRKASEKDDEKNKKRKRIVVMDDSDSSEDDVFASEEEDDVDQGRCPSPVMEDDDDEPVKEEAKEPTEPEQPTKKGRARKRVEVNKTFMDEDGYIVCKKVVEFVSCSEDEDEKENEREDKQRKGDQKLQKASPKKKSPPEKKKQATLMNFFKRS